MEKHHYKALIIACFVISGALIGFGLLSKEQTPKGDMKEVVNYAPPAVKAQGPEVSTLGSPDGKIYLTSKKEKTENGTRYTYLFSTSPDGEKTQIFEKEVPAETTISVPFNTFSPDNKYIFLKESTSEKTTYFVVAGGKELDISSAFEAKYKDYKITDVTGWGGPSLVVVNADKASGGQGPSFWFEVGNGGFIQLSNRFN